MARDVFVTGYAVIVLQLLYKVLDVLLGAFAGLRRVRVLAHLAWHVDLRQECFFVNVTNLSGTRDVEVTHVWFQHKSKHPILNRERPLPRRLRPDESWETWLPVPRVPAAARVDALSSFRVRLSNGRIIRSKPNNDVPPVGHIPGGKEDDHGDDPTETPKILGQAEESRTLALSSPDLRDHMPLQRPLGPTKTFVRELSARDLSEAIRLVPPLLRDRFRDEHYLGRWVRWRAIVRTISSSTWGGFSLMLDDVLASSEKPGGFFAYFGPDQLLAIDRVREGDTIEIEGRIYTFNNGEIDIDHCVLLAHDIGGPWRSARPLSTVL